MNSASYGMSSDVCVVGFINFIISSSNTQISESLSKTTIQYHTFSEQNKTIKTQNTT
jgi:hypothetical protein